MDDEAGGASSKLKTEGPDNVAEAVPAEKKRLSSIGRAFHFATRSDKFLLFIASICAMGQGTSMPLNMIFLGQSVNSFGTDDVGGGFNIIVISFVVLGAIGFVLGSIATTIFECLAERQIKLIKAGFVRGILRQEIAFFDQRDPGALATDIEQSAFRVRDGIGMKFGILWQMLAQFIAGYAVALVKGWRLALVMTAIVPCIGLAIGLLIRLFQKATKDSEEAYGMAGSIAEEIFPSMRTVAAFGLENHFQENFDEKINKSEKADVRMNTYKGISVGLIFVLLILSYALGWWYGTKMVADALLESNGTDFSTGGVVITVFSSILIASFSLGQIMPNISALMTASESVKTIIEISDRVSTVDPYSESGGKPQTLQGSISFKDVHFAYPTRTDRPIYSGLSFDIKPGESVALVGASGCGKSTIIQLLQRFYDVENGVIEVDGKDVREYNVQALRAKMALVSQEPRLFTGTIRNNVVYGVPDVEPKDVPDSEIEEATRKANAHGFISAFPQKLETNVGQAGSLLSGGQKQRIAIARAIIRNPAILILDEATSALDNESERVVQRALDELLKTQKRTTIIIAHRLTTIRTADKIVVLDNPDGSGARVVEIGSHEELVELEGGIYRTLVQAQQVLKQPATEESRALAARLSLASAAQGLVSQQSLKVADLNRESIVARILHSNSKIEESQRLASLPEDFVAVPSQKGLRTASGLRASSVVKDTPFELIHNHRARRLWTYATGDWFWIVVGTLGAMGAGAVFPVLSLMISQFLGLFFGMNPSVSLEDNVSNMRSSGTSKTYILIGLAAAAGVCTYLSQEGWGRVGEKLVSTMRRRVFHSIIYQDMEFFDNTKNNTGHLSSVLSADCGLTRGITGDNLAIIVQNSFSLVLAVILAFTGNAKLAGVVLASFALLVPAIYLQAKLSGSVRESRTDSGPNKLDAESTSFVLNEIVTNLRSIAAYGLQKRMEENYALALNREFQKGWKNAIVAGVCSGLATGLQSWANAISFWYAGHLMVNEADTVDVETIMRTIMVLMNAGAGLGRATAMVTDTKKAKAACANIFSLIDRVPLIDARDPSGNATSKIQGDFDFDKISFRYPSRPNNPILNEISFMIKAGQSIALVGASGCGKSTIVQLVERFYDLRPSLEFRLAVRNANDQTGNETEVMFTRGLSATRMFAGEVRLDNSNIQSFNLRHLRSQIGLVAQEPVLFQGSISDNIKYGKAGATQEDVIRAAQMANAADFIEKLPEGYDTTVGRGGGQMSGGQKQRIAIARALIRDPAILLFDEATSALDAESEAIVQKTLDSLTHAQHNKATTITIAHRLSTVRNADKIVVFAPQPGTGSTIAEQGTHEELMKVEDGIYRGLVNISAEAST